MRVSAGKVAGSKLELSLGGGGGEPGPEQAAKDAEGRVGTGVDVQPASESPFLAVKPLLRALQLLGVFNLSFDADCTSFRCRRERFDQDSS